MMYRVFITYSEPNRDRPSQPHISKVHFTWETLIEIFEGLIEHLPDGVDVIQITIRKI